MSIEPVFQKLWRGYTQVNPGVQKIYDLIVARGDDVINDHIALRTFAHDKVGLAALSKVFLDNGYKEGGEYHFKAKKLYAKHFEPPTPDKPKVFISELLFDQLSDKSQKIIHGLIDQVDESLPRSAEFCHSGQPWAVSWADYETLGKESEYAAWMSAFGYCANHFTVFVNELKSFAGLEELVDFIQAQGYVINESGGRIKGTKEVGLRQASTKADWVDVTFSCGTTKSIPSCYYEFATRYEVDGGLYQGFVTQSADKIFESTDR